MDNTIILPAFDPSITDAKKLKGFLHNTMHLKDSNVLIANHSYTVLKVKLLEITLFTVNGKLSFSHHGDTVRDQSKGKAFLLSCGISSKPLFLKKFFDKPVIDGTKAKINVWYHQFEENNYF